jgi:hypothetical protein
MLSLRVTAKRLLPPILVDALRALRPEVSEPLRLPTGWETVSAGPLQGFQLRLCRSEDWACRMLDARYEPSAVAEISRHVGPGTVCYDVGAHFGYLSLVMARLSGSTIANALGHASQVRVVVCRGTSLGFLESTSRSRREARVAPTCELNPCGAPRNGERRPLCGICGLISREPLQPDDLHRVRAVNRGLAHRGPNGAGEFVETHVALSMRRLSVIDLTGGWQPLYNEDRSVALVANGEIYNYVELRRDLIARGHVFRSGSDCETIVHLYEEHGPACGDRRNGPDGRLLINNKKEYLDT